jgi:thioredoxin-related protein
MKKLFLVPAALFAITLVAFTPAADPIKPGDAIPNPDLQMKDVSGKMISLKEAAKANGLLVMFSCNTCPYVIKNQARAQEAVNLARKFEIGAVILNSNEGKRSSDDSFEEMKEYAKSQSFNGYAWYLVDENSKQADAFGANRTPECYLFNKEGKLVYHGAIDDNPSDENAVTRKHLRMAMEEVFGGKEVTVKESRSVGCAIKRKA